MTSKGEDFRGAANTLLDEDEVQGVLSGAFYSPRPEVEVQARPQAKAPRPNHYKVICISLYNEDLSRLDKMVEELKERGFTKANRSALIRCALEQIDLDKIPRGILGCCTKTLVARDRDVRFMDPGLKVGEKVLPKTRPCPLA
jgi:hypothetical protein